MANFEVNLDPIGPAAFIGTADVQSAYWQRPVHINHVEVTVVATNSGKYLYKLKPFGVCKVPWLSTEVTQ